jgi:HlyD family secretion protein
MENPQNPVQRRMSGIRSRIERVPMPLRPIIALVVIITLVVIWNYVSALPAVRALTLGGDVTVSGTIEAEQMSVTAELGGRVIDLIAAEGDQVQANQVLLRLDSDTAQAELYRAQGARAEAQAKRDLAKNGARPEDKAQADASLAQATAARDGAKKAWEDAQAILKTPQDLDAKIIDAQAQVKITEQQIYSAQAQQSLAESGKSKYRGRGSDLEKSMYASFDFQAAAAQETMAAAMAQRDGALAALSLLTSLRNNSIELQAQVHQAEARYHDAEAATQLAQAARDLVYSGATKEDLAIAEAGLAQAQAAEKAAQARVDKLALRAPGAGRVSKRAVQIGQVISPGSVAMTMVSADKLTLTVYVPQDRLGKVRAGQSARVMVDSFPARAFTGRVTFISPQAEFTPKNVQTTEGRASQVFAVKIQMENPDNSLKPGMAADATLVQ